MALGFDNMRNGWNHTSEIPKDLRCGSEAAWSNCKYAGEGKTEKGCKCAAPWHLHANCEYRWVFKSINPPVIG